jgi:hypothetical protein
MTQLEIEFPRGPRPDRNPRIFALDNEKIDDPKLRHLLENGSWRRSSGSMICGWCHYEYRQHPTYPSYGLTVLCKNVLVHL